MSMPCPDQPAFTEDLPHDVMERAHAERVILYLGALAGMARSIRDLLCSAGIEDDQAHEEAGTVLRRSLGEARDLLSGTTGRAFDAIVEEFLRGARAAAPDGSCCATELLERIMRAAR